ncbi:uncharacterized protein LOC112464121 [Temnothorax curvispinosus]|uniref:Uncharacterized protein LOC112464121 n=1 Tax=Temnothorax curvispinosus TaxID=300111 RepID=A0A6J1QWK7_9HYME|nr:uncharacterized protein LOC112464121 [Temnothorax curvispinosus]
MTTTHTPPRTRSQAATSVGTEAGATHPLDAGVTLAESLQTVIQEVRLLREEQAQREKEYAETFRRQEEELRFLRGMNSGTQIQLSHSDNRASGDSGTRVAGGAEARDAHASEGDAIPSGTRTRDAYASERGTISSAAVARVACAEERDTISSGVRTRIHASDSVAVASADLGYKLKPDTYDGTTPLQEYLSQMSLIARANRWDDATKTVVLASSLRGKARSILETVQDVDCLDFAELKAKLELRFGEGHLTQNSYSALTNRRQRFGEDLATLGSDIERLSRLAYPECPYEIRDKIACSQFVSAVSDIFVRRTLQIEGITSLNRAVERAKALKIIQGDNYAREKEKTNKSFPKEGQNNNFNGKKGTEGNGKQAEEGKNEQRENSRGSKSASRDERGGG